MACSGITWEMMAAIRAALVQAALAAGASSADVASYFHSGSLPYSSGPWGYWEVNVTLLAADAQPAAQLAATLLTNAQSLLPPDQYGQLYVSSVQVDGNPYSPPKKRTPRWLIGVAVTLSLLVAIACGEWLGIWATWLICAPLAGSAGRLLVSCRTALSVWKSTPCKCSLA